VIARASLAVATVALSLVLADAGSASSVGYSATVAGTEIPPISSTLGTFAGVASGPVGAAWRVQIAHDPLASGPTVPVTGGRYSVVATSGLISGRVTGGFVTVVDRGRGCGDQRYRVTLQLQHGRFEGTLVHHRRSLLRRCVLYAATVSGNVSLAGAG
jgi:hypothetical protein